MLASRCSPSTEGVRLLFGLQYEKVQQDSVTGVSCNEQATVSGLDCGKLSPARILLHFVLLEEEFPLIASLLPLPSGCPAPAPAIHTAAAKNPQSGSFLYECGAASRHPPAVRVAFAQHNRVTKRIRNPPPSAAPLPPNLSPGSEQVDEEDLLWLEPRVLKRLAQLEPRLPCAPQVGRPRQRRRRRRNRVREPKGGTEAADIRGRPRGSESVCRPWILSFSRPAHPRPPQ